MQPPNLTPDFSTIKQPLLLANASPIHCKDDITHAFPELRLYCVETEEEEDFSKSAARKKFLCTMKDDCKDTLGNIL